MDEGFFLLVAELGGGGFEFFVEDFLGLGAVLLVLGEIEVAAGGDAFEFFGAEGEFAEDIDAGAGVVGEVVVGLPVVFEDVAEADAFVEAGALLDPVAVPHVPAPVGFGFGEVGAFMPGGDLARDDLDGFVGFDEEFEFHLLELAGAEGEVLGGDFVAEGFADLADAEGDLHAGGVEDVLELGEDGLGGFGAEVGDVGLGGGGAEVGLQHEVEGAGLAEHAAGFGVEVDAVGDDVDFLFVDQFDLFGFASGFTGVLGDESADAFAEAFDVFAALRQSGDGAIPTPAGGGLGAAVFEDRAGLGVDVISADAFVGKGTFAHEVGEGFDVAAGFPDGGVHEDAGVEAEDVLAFAGHGFPPGFAEVALQFGAERAVVPDAAAAAVDFAALVDEAAAFAEGDDFLHEGGVVLGFGGHGVAGTVMKGRVKSAMAGRVQGENGGC